MSTGNRLLPLTTLRQRRDLPKYARRISVSLFSRIFRHKLRGWNFSELTKKKFKTEFKFSVWSWWMCGWQSLWEWRRMHQWGWWLYLPLLRRLQRCVKAESLSIFNEFLTVALNTMSSFRWQLREEIWQMRNQHLRQWWHLLRKLSQLYVFLPLWIHVMLHNCCFHSKLWQPSESKEGNCTFFNGLFHYRGMFCEWEENECTSNPCQNGGQCVANTDTYFCVCINGFTGLNCELDLDGCNKLGAGDYFRILVYSFFYR